MSVELKKIDPDAISIVRKLLKHNFKAYLVGGCVRDLLLGLEPKDFDIVTNARPEEIKKIFKNCRLIGRRFRLAHILFANRKFIEVATFRGGDVTISKAGQVQYDNDYGTIEEDAIRRDLTINALYLDIKTKEIIDFVGGLKDIKNKIIKVIGEPKQRYIEDPVRMIRMIRFEQKLDFTIENNALNILKKQVALLENIPPARLLDEVLKLFHNENAIANFKALDKVGLLKYLFSETKYNKFIEVALKNTEDRIKENKPLTPSFLFAVFLWENFLKYFKNTSKKTKSKILAHQNAVELVIKKQVKQIMIPRWVSAQVSDIWFMQHRLEKVNPKYTQKILTNKRFRASYDFLLLRSKSISPELENIADFWTKAQK